MVAPPEDDVMQGLGRTTLWVTLVAAAACAGEKGSRTSAGGGIATASAGDSAGADTDDGGTDGANSDGPGSDSSDDSAGGSAGPIFDVGSGDTDGAMPDPEAGCRKVDFLFVIDNSVSMENEQDALVGAFPGFIEAIENTLSAGSDYHIMVTDTDDWGRCTPGGCSHDTCQADNQYACQPIFDACDKARGAGVVHPAGEYASNQVCNLFGGNRYIVEGEPDVESAFECIARVGVAGNPSERPMDAITAAMSDEINAPGGCNDGFLRDDAILVITFISDDPHYEDTDGPAQWYNAVLDGKNGDADAVVVLGLTPHWDGCREGDGDTRGEHWEQFVSMWGDHGLHGNVCSTAQDYVSFFEMAVSTIDEACDNFEPPG
jgi:hypothetical protein